MQAQAPGQCSTIMVSDAVWKSISKSDQQSLSNYGANDFIDSLSVRLTERQ
jgi:hypothetical protein